MLAIVASLVSIFSGQPTPHRLQIARFFYDSESGTLLRAVRVNMENAITFDGHFSQSYVSCGLACGTYFFVDRRTGGVITAPEGNPPAEITWDVATKRDSNVIKVTFGPMDGVGPGCVEQHFRLSGHKFFAVDRRLAISCPK